MRKCLGDIQIIRDIFLPLSDDPCDIFNFKNSCFFILVDYEIREKYERKCLLKNLILNCSQTRLYSSESIQIKVFLTAKKYM